MQRNTYSRFSPIPPHSQQCLVPCFGKKLRWIYWQMAWNESSERTRVLVKNACSPLHCSNCRARFINVLLDCYMYCTLKLDSVSDFFLVLSTVQPCHHRTFFYTFLSSSFFLLYCYNHCFREDCIYKLYWHIFSFSRLDGWDFWGRECGRFEKRVFRYISVSWQFPVLGCQLFRASKSF